MLSSLMVIAAMMISCEKEEVNVKDDKSKQDSTVATVEKKAADLKIWYDNGDPDGVDGEDYGCHKSGGSCYPEVVITPSTGDDLGDVIDDVNTEDREVIISSFQNNESLLNDLFGTDVVENVIDGVYTPSTRGELTADSRIYFLFNSAESLEVVKPVGEK